MAKGRPALQWSGILFAMVLIVAVLFWWIGKYPFAMCWIGAATAVSALAFWYDKSAAQKMSDKSITTTWQRIPEWSLLWSCLIGGTLGGLVVMLGRRHKTIDGSFKMRLGIIIGLQIGAILMWVWMALTSPH